MIPVRSIEELSGLGRVTCLCLALEVGGTPPKTHDLRVKLLRKTRVLLDQKNE